VKDASNTVMARDTLTPDCSLETLVPVVILTDDSESWPIVAALLVVTETWAKLVEDSALTWSCIFKKRVRISEDLKDHQQRPQMCQRATSQRKSTLAEAYELFRHHMISMTMMRCFVHKQFKFIGVIYFIFLKINFSTF